MRLFLFSFISFLALQISSYSQTEYIEIKSSLLNQTRQIKVQLPRNYNKSEKEYPVIIVLDGDYLFEPFVGNVDYLSYWEIIPEAIIVGINQLGYREKDGTLNPDNELPVITGAGFFEFIGLEVLKFIDDNYRTAPFRVIAGMDYMANFSNFYLLKPNPIFKGYINFSPDTTPNMAERVKNKLDIFEGKIWYYLATSEFDIPELQEKVKKLNSLFITIVNKNFNYEYEFFEDATHFSFVVEAIPKSLLSIFEAYRPISDFEYESNFLKAEFPSIALENKYLTIEELYALRIPIRVGDFLKTAQAIEERELWEDYKNLSRLAKKEAPETVLYFYFEGRYFEKIGKPKRAIKEYQAAYGLKPAGYINEDMLLNKADELRKIFGY